MLILVTSIIDGILYHLGGIGGVWWKSSWIRDIGVSLATLSCVGILFGWHWSLIPCFFLMWGALSTYWKCLNKYFNKPTSDCFWFNWLTHGIGVGLALTIYGYFNHCLGLTLVRSIVLGLSMMIWSHFVHKVAWDEGGRGALIGLTLHII